MKVAPECKDWCQYAQDVAMPEYSCARECQYLMAQQSGTSIKCAACSGHGVVGFGSECNDCAGSGRNWQYPNGALAKYYGGPFIGRDVNANH